MYLYFIFNQDQIKLINTSLNSIPMCIKILPKKNVLTFEDFNIEYSAISLHLLIHVVQNTL